MPSHVVDKVLAQPRHQAQGFHVGPERMVVLRREEGDAGIVTILPDQRECFRQQLDASEVVGLLPPVFQPEAALVILEEVLPGDAYRIGIRSFSKFSRLIAFGVLSVCLGSVRWQTWYFSEWPSL